MPSAIVVLSYKYHLDYQISVLKNFNNIRTCRVLHPQIFNLQLCSFSTIFGNEAQVMQWLYILPSKNLASNQAVQEDGCLWVNMMPYIGKSHYKT